MVPWTVVDSQRAWPVRPLLNQFHILIHYFSDCLGFLIFLCFSQDIPDSAGHAYGRIGSAYDTNHQRQSELTDGGYAHEGTEQIP